MLKSTSCLLAAITVVVLMGINAPAFAAGDTSQQTPIPAASHPTTQDDMPITMGPGMEDFDSLKGPDREKRFEEMRQKLRDMSPEERQAWREKRKQWFDNLPADQKDALKAKMKKNRLVRMNYVIRDMPEQCQAIVKKCMADNGEPLDQKPADAPSKK